MPIVIAQPSMVSPQISSAYGAAEQWSKDFPNLERQQQSIAEANMAASRQAAGLAAQTQALSAQAYAHGSSLANQRWLQEGQLQAEAGRTEYLEQARQANVQQQAELTDWLNSRQMTMADNQRLTRLNSGLSAVEADERAGNLTPQEATALKLQLRTGIDPLQQRQEAQKAKMMEMQVQEAQHNMARAKAAEVQNQEFEARLKEQGHGVFRMIDPDTGKSHTLIQNPTTGEWYNPLTAGGRSGSSAKADDLELSTKTMDAARKQAEFEFPDDEVDPVSGKAKPSLETLKKRGDRAREIVEGFQERHEPQRPFTPGDTANMSKMQVKTISALSERLKQIEKADMPDAERAQAIDAIHTLHAELAKYGSFQKPVKPIAVQDAAKIVNAQKTLQSVPLKEPSTTSPANSAVKTFDDALQDFNSRPVAPQVKLEINQMVEKAKRMLAEAGGYKKLNATEKAQYDDYQQKFRRALATAPPPAPPQQAAPPAGPPQTGMGGGMRMPSWIPSLPRLNMDYAPPGN